MLRYVTLVHGNVNIALESAKQDFQYYNIWICFLHSNYHGNQCVPSILCSNEFPLLRCPLPRKIGAPTLPLCPRINILHLSSNYCYLRFPPSSQHFCLEYILISLLPGCVVCTSDKSWSRRCAQWVLDEEGMRVLGLRCALPDSNGSEHGLGWLRRVSYPGHSKLRTITKVETDCNNPLELLLSHQESGLEFQKNIG